MALSSGADARVSTPVPSSIIAKEDTSVVNAAATATAEAPVTVVPLVALATVKVLGATEVTTTLVRLKATVLSPVIVTVLPTVIGSMAEYVYVTDPLAQVAPVTVAIMLGLKTLIFSVAP